MGGSLGVHRGAPAVGSRPADPADVTAPYTDRRRVSVDLALVAAVALGAALRLWGVTGQSLWFDEWSTARASRGGLGDLAQYLRGADGLPPPYFMGMWVWAHVFGQSALALRSTSVIAGIATIPVMYAAAQAFGMSRHVARVVAVLVAVNPMLVWYSQEARSYSPLVLCSSLSLWGFARVRVSGQSADWRFWGLASAAVVTMHYFGLLLIGAEAVDLWRRHPEWQSRMWRAAWPIVVVLVILAPWAVVQQSRQGSQDWIADFPLRDRLYDWVTNALIGPVPLDGRLWLLGLAVVALAAVMLVVRVGPAERATAALLVALGLTVVVVPLAATVVGVDAVLSRYLIAAMVPLVLAVAIGLGHRRSGWLGPLGMAVIVAVSIPTVVLATGEPDLSKPDWHEVARVLDGGESRDGNRVVIASESGYKALPLLDLLNHAKELTGTHRARDVVEVDVLFGKGTSHPCNLWVGLACSMGFLGELIPAPTLDRVFLVERVELDQFVVERYGLRVPTLSVTRRDLLPPTNRKSGKVIVWRPDS